MEITKRLDQIDPQFLPLVERLFAHSIETPASAELVLRVEPAVRADQTADEAAGEIPSYFNVLEGMTDQEIAEFDADLRNNRVQFRSNET